MRAEQFWAEGVTARLYMAVDEAELVELEDSWVENPTIDGDGESWQINVDDRGIAWTHAWDDHGPLYLDELPDPCVCGHDRDDHASGRACFHMTGTLVDGATLCGCRAFEARP